MFICIFMAMGAGCVHVKVFSLIGNERGTRIADCWSYIKLKILQTTVLHVIATMVFFYILRHSTLRRLWRATYKHVKYIKFNCIGLFNLSYYLLFLCRYGRFLVNCFDLSKSTSLLLLSVTYQNHCAVLARPLAVYTYIIII